LSHSVDAADEGDIGLHHVHRLGLQIGQELLPAVEALAQRDRGSQGLAQGAMAGDVVAQDRLLDPAQAQPVQTRPVGPRLGGVPFLVQVHQQLAALAEPLLDAADALDCPPPGRRGRSSS